MCNQWGCSGELRPTRVMWDCGGSIANPTHRLFKCPVCGNETPWLDKPAPNGGHGELHHCGSFTYSGMSMMSDPAFHPPKPPRINRPQRPKRPVRLV